MWNTVGNVGISFIIYVLRKFLFIIMIIYFVIGALKMLLIIVKFLFFFFGLKRVFLFTASWMFIKASVETGGWPGEEHFPPEQSNVPPLENLRF